MTKTPDFSQNKTFSDLISESSKKHPMPETGWNLVGPSEDHGIDFQNSWANAGPSTVPTSWYLDENGATKLRGKISGGSSSSVVFTLPQEVRPEFDQTYIVPVEDDGSVHLENIEFRAFEE